MQNPIGIGLVGTGGRLRYVARRLKETAGDAIRIAGIYDPDPGSVNSAKEIFGSDVPVYESEEDLLARKDIDWVLIGSMNCQHADQAIKALKAGKHVFCEKPLATNLEDCLRVRDVVRETGQTFAFGLVLRYSPHYQKVRELMASGRIGELISFEFNETLSPDHGGYIFGNWRRHRHLAGTHLLEKCCHDLDLANWITGRLPLRAASFGGRNFFIPRNAHQTERIGPNKDGRPAFGAWPDPHRVDPFSEGADIVDNQVIIFEYQDQIRASFHTNCNAAIRERRFYLCGTEGVIRADAVSGKIEICRSEQDSRIEEVVAAKLDGHAGGDAIMAQGLTATIVEGKPPLASVEEGLRACIAAFGADDAMDQGKVIDLHPYWEQAGISVGS